MLEWGYALFVSSRNDYRTSVKRQLRVCYPHWGKFFFTLGTLLAFPLVVKR